MVAEIDSKISTAPGEAVQIAGLEERLTYTMACIQENFRINPVFTMPLPRKVAVPGGVEIDGNWVPENVRSSFATHLCHAKSLIFLFRPPFSV